MTQPIRLFYFFFYQGRHVGNSLVGLCNTPFGRPFTFLPPPQRSAIERNFRQQAPYRHGQEKVTRLPKKLVCFPNGSSARNNTPYTDLDCLELPFSLLSTEGIGMFVHHTFFLFLLMQCISNVTIRYTRRLKSNRVIHLGLSIIISPFTQVHLFIQEL